MKNSMLSIAVRITLLAVVLFPILGCTPNKPEDVEAISEKLKLPSSVTQNMTTIISDSGVVRARITAPELLVFDQEKEPYWDFPKGIHLERFKPGTFEIESEIQCKYARRFIKKKLWKLQHDVKGRNIKNELFESELLYWDEAKKKVYTDKFFRWTTPPDYVQYGNSFEANQDFTEYEIKNSGADLYFDSDSTEQ